MLALLTLTDLGARFRIAFIRPMANTGLTDLVGNLQVELHEPTDPAQESAMVACGLIVDLMRDPRVAQDIPFFAVPVSEEEAPGYMEVIEQPMDLQQILQASVRGEMRTAQDVFAAIDPMLANAIRYNDKDHVVHVAAERVKVVLEKTKRRKRERLAAAVSLSLS